MLLDVVATNTNYNGTFPITVTSPTTWTYHLASDPGGTASTAGIRLHGSLISDDAHLAVDFLMEGGPAGDVGNAFWTHWSAGTPGTFSKNYWDYSGSNGAGGAEWHPADGDKIIFPPFNSCCDPNALAPGGLSYATPYYAVNTHFGSLSALSWSGGVIFATTSSAHGLTIGNTYNIGINGTAPAGYEWSYDCTIASTTTFTCPSTLGNPGVATYFGTWNTYNMAASPGGSALAITDTRLINDNFKSGMLPASAPPNWLGTDYVNASISYPPLMTGGWNYMAAVGVTGFSTFSADALRRFNATLAYFGFTRGTFFQVNPKWAIGSSF